MPLAIEDYALIGDCETAALVGRDGSIDWLCSPRFDSAACFAHLLGSPQNGRWLIGASDHDAKVTRAYKGDTLVLETRIETATGVATVTDFMTTETSHFARCADRRRARWPRRFHDGVHCPLRLRVDHSLDAAP